MYRGCIPHPFKFPILDDHCNRFELELGGDLADFIQKNTAFVTQLEPTDLVFYRTGEGPFYMAEQFAFQ